MDGVSFYNIYSFYHVFNYLGFDDACSVFTILLTFLLIIQLNGHKNRGKRSVPEVEVVQRLLRLNSSLDANLLNQVRTTAAAHSDYRCHCHSSCVYLTFDIGLLNLSSDIDIS